jgi:HAD superfamily hydrolase (TIGR01509 family)
MLPTDLIIFDCDGVLVDSEVLSVREEVAFLREQGFDITVQDIVDRYMGISVAAMLADLEARFGRRLPKNLAETLRQRIAMVFEGELTVMPGVPALLETLPGKICVASSSAPQRLRQSLSLTGLLARFEPHIFSATQVARGKPAPDLFLFAAERMGVSPDRCLVIEDSIAGVTATRAAGMTALGFCGGSHCAPGHKDRLRGAGASHVFDHMDQVALFLAAGR